MTANISQARRYREMVRSDLKLLRYQTPPSSDSDIALYILLEDIYNEGKKRLSRLLDEGTSDSVIRLEKSGLFVFASGLFTFGRLDVAEDILSGIPSGKGSIRQLAWVLNVLLPMPKGMDALTAPDAVREWLQVKRSRLRWDKSSENYILENFRVLPDLPTDSVPEQFTVTNDEISQKGLVIEVQPDTGINWIGNFQPGKSGISVVCQHPNRIDLVVISQGQGYIINPENHQIIETFGGSIFDVIELPESHFILCRDSFGSLGYGSSGLLWQNPEISWNGIRQLKVQGNILIGEFQRSNESAWNPFWLNIKSGELHLEKYSPRELIQERPWWQFW